MYIYYYFSLIYNATQIIVSVTSSFYWTNQANSTVQLNSTVPPQRVARCGVVQSAAADSSNLIETST